MYLAKKTALILNVFLLLGIVYIGVDTVFFAVTARQEPDPLQHARSATTDGVAGSPSTQKLAVGALFGAPVQTGNIDAAAVAVKTQLQLELLSTVTGSASGASSALIRIQDGAAETYRINDMVAGRARLAVVSLNHVLLKHQGVLETLSFPAQGNAALAAAFTPDASLPGARAGSLEATGKPVVASESGAPAKTAAGLLSRLDIDKQGYYRPGGDIDLHKWVGLKAGDRILSINGETPSSIIDNPMTLGLIMATGRIKLNVQRGGERIVITAALR